MDNAMRLTEQDFDDLIEAVGLWGKESPEMSDAGMMILSKLISGQDDKEKLELLIMDKRAEFQQKKKQRERDAALLSTKLIMIQRELLDKSPNTFDLKEHLK